jgi:hypothetical protein
MMTSLMNKIEEKKMHDTSPASDKKGDWHLNAIFSLDPHWARSIS